MVCKIVFTKNKNIEYFLHKKITQFSHFPSTSHIQNQWILKDIKYFRTTFGVVLDQNQYSGQNVDFVMTVGPWTTKNDAGVLEMHLQCSLTRLDDKI